MNHICHRCKHTFSEPGMTRVSIYDGEYTNWTPARAAYFRSHSMKYPPLVWLCAGCYGDAQQTQTEEWRTGEPASPRPQLARRKSHQGRK